MYQKSVCTYKKWNSSGGEGNTEFVYRGNKQTREHGKKLSSESSDGVSSKFREEMKTGKWGQERGETVAE